MAPWMRPGPRPAAHRQALAEALNSAATVTVFAGAGVRGALRTMRAQQAADAQLPATGVPLELERRLSSAFIRGTDYGTRASTLLAIDHDGGGFIHERRFGPEGVFVGETRVEIGVETGKEGADS